MAFSNAACPSEVEIDLFPFIRVYRNGTVERLLGTDTVPASLDDTTGVSSKDVTIDPATGLSVRLYLPPAAAAAKKLPILVYFHGGGFMVESAASPRYHAYLNNLAARAGALAVSVEYRRVPELEARIRSDWRFMCACPDAEVDDPWLCPTSASAAPRLVKLSCRRVMVAVAGNDFLAVKGRAYYTALLASGWRGEAELVDTPGKDHVFHLRWPETEAASEMMDRVVVYISRV